jgi:hypothetical protein
MDAWYGLGTERNCDEHAEILGRVIYKQSERV